MKIAYAAQLAPDPAFPYFAAKCGELFGGSIARTQCVQNRFRRQHAALDGHVNSLQALGIHQARGIADDQAAIQISARDGIPAAYRDRLGAVTHQLAACENPAHEWMRLEFLKGFVRIESRIMVFEPGHQSQRNALISHAVDPTAAVHARVERPAKRMRHPSCFDASRRHFPEFLYPDAIDLRLEPVEIVLANELLGQRSARTLRQHSDLGAEFITRREVVFGLSIFVPAFVLRDYARDALALVNQLRPGELREDVDARLLRKSAQPLRQLAQRDDVIAVIS